MDYLKGYVKSVGDFVSSVIEEPPDPAEDETEESKPTESSQNGASSDKSSGGDSLRFLDWVPKFKTSTNENPLLYCINSLASFGSDAEKPDALNILETPPTHNETENSTANTSSVTGDTTEPQMSLMDSDFAFANWINGLSLRTEEAWKQMKKDFNEVVTVMSAEQKEAVASLRQHLSSAASAMGKIDPNRFTLLPESDTAKEADEMEPPPPADVPSLSTLRSDMGSFMSGIVANLFGSDGSKSQGPVKTKREARLQVLRADPATYELEPPVPPAHLGAHNYADWRAAYFDEITCQPLPGIPLCGSRETPESEPVEEMLEPRHPSPEELLEQNPFMRTYLSKLVNLDQEAKGHGLTDGDFWSRYYYRVYLLDVTERRRKLLTKRVDAIPPLDRSADVEGAVAEVSRDWLELSDHESMETKESKPKDTMVCPRDPPENVTEKSPVDGRKPKRSRRKRSNNAADRSNKSTTPTEPTHPKPVEESAKAVAVEQKPAAPSAHKCNGESDEAVTSCSSSVVVLSNSEEDAELLVARPDASASSAEAKTRRKNESSEQASAEEWGDICEEELKELNITQSISPQKDTKEEENKPTSDWDMWS